jgi:hypothetical protein
LVGVRAEALKNVGLEQKMKGNGSNMDEKSFVKVNRNGFIVGLLLLAGVLLFFMWQTQGDAPQPGGVSVSETK